jgi:tetratricopeptide (TPR) repeat protein
MHSDSQVGLAGALLRKGRPAEALEVIQPAVERNLNYADVYLMQGLASLRLNRQDAARDALERAYAITQTYADVHIALGMLAYADGDVADARQWFERALARSPERRDEVQPWLQRIAERSR